MALNTVYGIGGYCAECDPSHDHPLHNIIEQVEVPDPEPAPVDTAMEKLKAIGLTEDEINALLGRG
jgi:hypothetical protein